MGYIAIYYFIAILLATLGVRNFMASPRGPDVDYKDHRFFALYINSDLE
jgi:hypothetical protein